MTDFEFDMMTMFDRHVVNPNMLKSKDRDIKEIVFDSYSNLKSTIVIAHDYDIADLETMFNCDFKDYIAKYKKDEKKYEYSTNADFLDNIYSKLRIKYIIDPDHVSPKYRRTSLGNTIAGFEEAVRGYKYVNWKVLDMLKAEYQKEEEAYKEALEIFHREQAINPIDFDKRKIRGRKSNIATVVEQLSLKKEEIEANLFIPEQIILIPEIDKYGKYNIDGINYYGIYNNVDKGLVTQGRNLGFKVFKEGTIKAAYFGVEYDENFGYVLFVMWYGEVFNPLHLLTRKKIDENINPRDLLVFNNVVNNPDWDELIENTYQKAMYMEMNPEAYTLVDTKDKKEKGGISNKKVMHLPEEKYRAMRHERRYKIELNIGLKMYLVNKDKQSTKDQRYFIHLDKFEEVILRHINGETKIPKKINPSKGSKRINLNPTQLTTVIKKGSDENADTVLFRDKKTEPNPFDIFNIFAYAQTSNHTHTNSNQHVSSKAKKTGETTNWIKWRDLPYLSIYFSKNNSPLGKNNMLHFNIQDDVFIERSNRKEIFKDIYDATTL